LFLLPLPSSLAKRSQLEGKERRRRGGTHVGGGSLEGLLVVKTRLGLLDAGNLVLHELVVWGRGAGGLLLLLLGDLGGVRLGHCRKWGVG